MSYEAGNIFYAGQRMVFFADANKILHGTLPVAVALFNELKTTVGGLETAGVSRSSATSAGKSETRTKGEIYSALGADLRAVAGTAAIIKKIVPNFENRFLLQPDKLTFQEAIERGRAFHADSAPADVEKLFTDYGLAADFRQDLLADTDALADATHSQADAKRESVGDTAQIDDLLEKLMDLRESLKRIMKNLLVNNPEKMGEWRTASHIEYKKPKPKTPTA